MYINCLIPCATTEFCDQYTRVWCNGEATSAYVIK